MTKRILFWEAQLLCTKSCLPGLVCTTYYLSQRKGVFNLRTSLKGTDTIYTTQQLPIRRNCWKLQAEANRARSHNHDNRAGTWNDNDDPTNYSKARTHDHHTWDNNHRTWARAHNSAPRDYNLWSWAWTHRTRAWANYRSPQAKWQVLPWRMEVERWQLLLLLPF